MRWPDHSSGCCRSWCSWPSTSCRATPLSIDRVVAYVLAFGIVALATSRPDLCLLALIVLLPFQGLMLAKLWDWGVPVSVAKDLGTWKEALGLAVVIAGARNYIASGRRADAVDRLALAFVGFAALYFVAQPEIVPGAPATISVRALGFRETAGFVLLMLGARHAPLPPGFARRAAKALLAAGVVVAGAGDLRGDPPRCVEPLRRRHDGVHALSGGRARHHSGQHVEHPDPRPDRWRPGDPGRFGFPESAHLRASTC